MTVWLWVGVCRTDETAVRFAVDSRMESGVNIMRRNSRRHRLLRHLIASTNISSWPISNFELGQGG